MCGLLQTPTTLPTGQRVPCAQWLRDRVESRIGLDIMRKKGAFILPGIKFQLSSAYLLAVT